MSARRRRDHSPELVRRLIASAGGADPRHRHGARGSSSSRCGVPPGLLLAAGLAAGPAVRVRPRLSPARDSQALLTPTGSVEGGPAPTGSTSLRGTRPSPGGGGSAHNGTARRLRRGGGRPPDAVRRGRRLRSAGPDSAGDRGRRGGAGQLRGAPLRFWRRRRSISSRRPASSRRPSPSTSSTSPTWRRLELEYVFPAYTELEAAAGRERAATSAVLRGTEVRLRAIPTMGHGPAATWCSTRRRAPTSHWARTARSRPAFVVEEEGFYRIDLQASRRPARDRVAAVTRSTC